MITPVRSFNDAKKVRSVLKYKIDCGFTLCLFFLSSSQDEKLKKLVEQHGTDSWKLIANVFPVSISSIVRKFII